MSKFARLVAECRAKRWSLFENLLDSIEHPANLLVIDGNPDEWGSRYGPEAKVSITILHIKKTSSVHPHIRNHVGDARAMPEFSAAEFDMVYTNSVIEHVGTFNDQVDMADEVRRISSRYFVQTPNRYFPIEPHYELPWFQHYPRSVQRKVLQRLHTGPYGTSAIDELSARRQVAEVELLSKRDLALILPDAVLVPERFLGFTKSWMAIRGWDERHLSGQASAVDL